MNRAIDEVENDRVPAVILVCRNSTDSAYFQRLTPYPRVLLRRRSALFKDYDKSPIGFGIIVFCIAKGDCHDLYTRFIKHFGPAGEPNIVVDKGIDRLQYCENYRRTSLCLVKLLFAISSASLVPCAALQVQHLVLK